MDTTLFWVLFVLVLLLVFWIFKKYFGRIILIGLFFFVFFFIFKWINHEGANSYLRMIKDIPEKVTSFIYVSVLNRPVVLKETIPQEVVLEQKSLVEEENRSWFSRIFGSKKKGKEELIELKEEFPAEKKQGWFSRLFGAKKQEVIVVEEEVIIVEREETPGEVATQSGVLTEEIILVAWEEDTLPEEIFEKDLLLEDAVDLLWEEETLDASISQGKTPVEQNVRGIPSALSEADIREAQELFN